MVEGVNKGVPSACDAPSTTPETARSPSPASAGEELKGSLMPKGVKKADLPAKVCAACGRPFTWRKKWARDWENVRYCSDACRAKGAGK